MKGLASRKKRVLKAKLINCKKMVCTGEKNSIVFKGKINFLSSYFKQRFSWIGPNRHVL